MKRLGWFVSSLVAAVVLTSGVAQAGSGRLEPGEYLFPGQRITQSCYYSLQMVSNGDLTAFSGNVRNWSSNTAGVGGYAVMRADGNFVVYDWDDVARWSTNTFNQTYYAYSRCSGTVHCSPTIGGCVCDTGTPSPMPFQTNNFVWQRDDGYLAVYSRVPNDAPYPLWSPGYASDWLGQTCATPEQKTIVKVNFDRPGNNFQTIPIPVRRPSWCGFFCAMNSACKAYAYTFPAPTGEPAACWLKNAVTTPVPLNGAVTGEVVGR